MQNKPCDFFAGPPVGSTLITCQSYDPATELLPPAPRDPRRAGGREVGKTVDDRQ